MHYKVVPTKVAWETKTAIDQGYRIIANQGGTRSTKTYSITDVLIGVAFTTKKSISITSISLPHIKKGVMRDWRELMEVKGGYDPLKHNMTDQLYEYPLGGYIEFFSVDDAKRVRGPGRDILFINEANLLSLDTWRQLILRTKETIIIDWNPADEFHWIYDDVLSRNDCKFIQSTYLDNPFLSKAQVNEIERLKDIDENFWKIYGLGERGTNQETVYPKYQLFDSWPDTDYCFGLDFGFTHPNALVKCGIDEQNIFFEQMVYQSQLSTPDLIQVIKPIVNNKYVWCDSARPEIINDLQMAGINAYPTKKYEGSVKDGIDFVRSHLIFVHRESVDFQKEMRSYKWKKKISGAIVDEPVKAFDDLMDAARYAAISMKNVYSSPVISFH
jgi:phage terminase large subunit